MEALAVFGIACNVIQVISFTRETISLCKTIYTSGIPFDNDGYTNKVVSDYTRTCHDLQRKITDAGAGGCPEEKELLNIAKDCLHAAEKLKTATSKLESPSLKGNALRSIYAGVSAKYKGGRLNKLEVTLNKHQARLESHLLKKICKTTDATAMQQSKSFAALDKTLQTFIQNIANGYQNLESLLVSQEASINAHTSMTVALQAKSIKRHITEELSQAHQAIAIQIIEKSQVARDYNKETINTSYARLMSSLKSSGLQERKTKIEVAHKGTLEWIYDSSKWRPTPENDCLKGPPTDTPHPDHTCGLGTTAMFDCFTCWLACPPGTTYWVSGKSGSGKSTLAKFLVSHAKTKQHLESAHGPTLIMSHFIWLSGTPIQRSLNGILLSLLNQFIHQDQITEGPEDISKAPRERSWAQNAANLIMKTVPGASHKESIMDWSFDELQDALAALLNTSPVTVCILLDGLDEADTDARSVEAKSVLLLADWLCRIPSIKLCVTSRPEPAFRSWFASHPQLELQHLTWGDIREFVIDKLESQLVSDSGGRECDDLAIKELTRKICQYSDGVFLWVRLVTRSLLRGKKNGDTPIQMHERLELLPRDLNELYKSMWQRLEEEDQEIYRREAALYINLALDESLRSLVVTFLSAVQLCAAASPETTLKIFADPDTYSFKTLRAQYTQFAKRLELVTAGLLEVTDEKRDFTMPVSFIHRSAREFFEGTPEGKKFLSVDKLERRDRFERLVRGGLVAIWYAWYKSVSMHRVRSPLSLHKLYIFVKAFNDAFKTKILDRRQILSLVYHCQQAYDKSMRLTGHRREAIVWEFDTNFTGNMADNQDFNIIFCGLGDKDLLVSCLGTDLGSQESIGQIMRDDLSTRRLPMVISPSYKAFFLHYMLRTDFPNPHQGALWMLDQGISDNWPQGKNAAGLIQGLAGAAVLSLLRIYGRREVEWQNFEVLRRCLALDGAWGENVLFAFEEAVPRSAGCSISRDLICGNLIPLSASNTSYIVQIQATMPFLVSSIIQTVARPDGGETLAIVKKLEDEVSRRFPDGLPPAKMFSLHWDDYRTGGGKLGEYGFVNISQESWSSLSLDQFTSLLKPGPPGPLQEAIQALDIESCERWDIEGIREEMLKRVLA